MDGILRTRRPRRAPWRQGRRATLGEGAGGVRGRREVGPVSSTGEVVSRTARGWRASRVAGGEAQEDGAQGQDAA